MTMKRILLTGSLMLLALFFAVAASAQDPASGDLFAPQDTAARAKPHEVFCELVSYTNGIFTNKVTVDIDFGQQTKFWSRDRALIDEAGRDIVFNSILDAANYMGERGWVFKQAYIIQSITKGDSGSPTVHWIMAKTVTSPEEITEGLRTRGMKRP